MTTSSNNKVFSIGYVPVLFPRDPIEVNFAEEHTILGQVIEPILTSNKSGKLDSDIAEKWSLNADNTIITITIKENRLFSDGKTVSANDVAYSIKRHLNNSKSQSSLFLRDIESINAIDTTRLNIKLFRANPAILKALTRDQLGILPENWIFDSNSNEPYIGTGPYRAIKKDDKWYLLANQNFNGNHVAQISQFELIFYENIHFKMPNRSLPDVIPDLSHKSLTEVMSHPDFRTEKYLTKENVSFAQTGFWIYPTSSLYAQHENRIYVASVLSKAILAYSKKNKINLATGMIPVGASGCLTERPTQPDLSSPKPPLEIKIAYLPGVFDEFISDDETKRIFEEHRVVLSTCTFTPQDISMLSEQKPDIVTSSWAGAFNDPAGFLWLLNFLLNKPFDEYLKDHNLDLNDASLEKNEIFRLEKFKNLSQKIIGNGLNIPGWHVRTYFVSKPQLCEEEKEQGFTSRFSNIRAK